MGTGTRPSQPRSPRYSQQLLMARHRWSSRFTRERERWPGTTSCWDSSSLQEYLQHLGVSHKLRLPLILMQMASLMFMQEIREQGLNKDEIENMVREAEANAEADKINRERVEAINQAEGILHDTESKMEEFKDQLPSEDTAKMKEKIVEVRDKLQDKENMDPEEIKKTVSDLQQSSLKLFEMAYKKMASDRDSSSGSSDSSSSDEKKEDKQ